MLSQIAYLRGSLLLHYIPKLPISQHLQVLQGSSGPRTDIKKRKNTNRSIDLSVRHKTSLLCVIFWKVIMHFFSRAEYLFTVVARNFHSFHMMCLNMSHDVSCKSFFSTYLTSFAQFLPVSYFKLFMTFLHHWFNSFIQMLQVCRHRHWYG